MSPHSRYTILRKIADGGTAEIFLAKQTGAQGFEKMVVLKRIFNSFYSDPQFRHMLVDEAHIAMSLNHSNIVQVLDLGEAEGRHFLALELVDGWTLDEVLKRAKTANVPFPPALALYLTAEVGRALAYAHSKSRDGQPLGIVHRDISPHNVLLSEHGEVKLTDFGIAKSHSKQEKSAGNMIKGKIAFMSPEQASGQALDARSDLFSLGTMLYVMIVRRPPFDAATDLETLMQVRAGDFIPPESARPGLNPEIYRVMRRAMGKTPEDRYQKADEMLVDVEQVMRVAFRAVGQTELARWLADLGAKDGIQPLTRAPPPPVSDTIVMDRPPVPPPPGTESSVELDLDDAEAVVVASAPHAPAPPPPVPPDSRSHVTSLRPVPFWRASPLGKYAVRAAGAGALLTLIAFAGVRLAKMRPHPTGPSASTSATTTTTTAAPPPPTLVPAPAPAPAPTTATTTMTTPVTMPAPTAVAATTPSQPAADADTTPPSAPGARVATADPTPKAGALAVDDEPAADDDGDADAHPGARDPSEKDRAKKAPQVSVTIKSDPEGSAVGSRHHAFGSTPVSVKLRSGNSYELTFTKAGYLPSTKVYRIVSTTRTIHVSLKRAPVSRPAAAEATNPPEPKKSWWQRHFSR
jgi:serine/threonine-protein kinase